jgi:tetratricopeptide (TPR) repeat protein
MSLRLRRGDKVFDEIHKLLRSKKFDAARAKLLNGKRNRIEERFQYDPNHARYLLGCIEFESGNYKAAVHAFKLSLRHRVDDVDALIALGNSYSELRQFGMTKRTLVRALDLAAHDSRVKYNLANVLFDLNDYSGAIALYKQVKRSKREYLARSAKKNIVLAQARLSK